MTESSTLDHVEGRYTNTAGECGEAKARGRSLVVEEDVGDVMIFDFSVNKFSTPVAPRGIQYECNA